MYHRERIRHREIVRYSEEKHKFGPFSDPTRTQLDPKVFSCITDAVNCGPDLVQSASQLLSVFVPRRQFFVSVE